MLWKVRAHRDHLEQLARERIAAARWIEGGVTDSVVIGVGDSETTFTMSRKDIAEMVMKEHEQVRRLFEKHDLNNEIDLDTVCSKMFAYTNTAPNKYYPSWFYAPSDSDLANILAKVGIQVSEPAASRSFESLLHCYLQWFLRDQWILEPLDQEQQKCIVDHVVSQLSRFHARGPPDAADETRVSMKSYLTLDSVVKEFHEIAVHGRCPGLEPFLFDVGVWW